MEALNEVLEKPLRHSQSLKKKNRVVPYRRPVHGAMLRGTRLCGCPVSGQVGQPGPETFGLSFQ
jgi:hypothetical protein